MRNLFIVGFVSLASSATCSTINANVALEFCLDPAMMHSPECEDVFDIVTKLQAVQHLHRTLIPIAVQGAIFETSTFELPPWDGLYMDSLIQAFADAPEQKRSVLEPMRMLEDVAHRSTTQFVTAVIQRWIDRQKNVIYEHELAAGSGPVARLEADISAHVSMLTDLTAKRARLTLSVGGHLSRNVDLLQQLQIVKSEFLRLREEARGQFIDTRAIANPQKVSRVLDSCVKHVIEKGARAGIVTGVIADLHRRGYPRVQLWYLSLHAQERLTAAIERLSTVSALMMQARELDTQIAGVNNVVSVLQSNLRVVKQRIDRIKARMSPEIVF